MCVCECARESVMCTDVDVEADVWHLSGWGAYENISPKPGQISTSVMLEVVTDSQTLRVLPPLPPLQKNK